MFFLSSNVNKTKLNIETVNPTNETIACNKSLPLKAVVNFCTAWRQICEYSACSSCFRNCAYF